ncbi:hypothetical protein LTR78_006666 [Recurvomyces mirabilis]|uniref:Uncharacterized protein n=1 Tax=Recurvomyces mirabilis TaxID=574656 RepID=A0AAE1BZN9_9PEZI|nr:hypothetical protein LTR78_006666 [Recurvomyces mirabilis]KAK5151445.1 hypothetical protein LTS14_009288 [Recurvomyces mirabilis]
MGTTRPSTLQAPGSCRPPRIKQCPILDAPREVRNTIYKHWSNSLDLVVIKHHGSIANRVSLLQTCPKIRSEATDLILHRGPLHDTVVKIAVRDLDFSDVVAYVEMLHEKELEQLGKKSVIRYSCTLSDAEVPDLTNHLLAWLQLCSGKYLFMNGRELGILHPQVYWFIGVTRRLPEPWLEEVEIGDEAIRPTSSWKAYQCGRIVPMSELAKIKWNAASQAYRNRIHGLEQNVRRNKSEEWKAEQKFKDACGVLYASIDKRSVAMHAVVRDEDLERRIEQEQRVANHLERVHVQREEESADARNAVLTAREQTLDE